MDDAAHVFRPANVFWILRTRQNEVLQYQSSGGFAKHRFDFLLPIRRVGPHVTEVASIFSDGREVVLVGVKRAVEGNRSLNAEPGFEFTQCRTPCKAEIDIEAGNIFSAKIFCPSLAQLCQRNRSIDIVKSFYGAAFEDLASSLDAVWKIGSQQCNICRAQFLTD